MIKRVSEYLISCDDPDCRNGYAEAFCVHTRQDCADTALEKGWAKATYNRWICPDCKRRIDAKAAAAHEVAA